MTKEDKLITQNEILWKKVEENNKKIIALLNYLDKELQTDTKLLLRAKKRLSNV